MALFGDDAGKTEKPTPKRLGEARDKGRTPLSREFVMAGVLLSAVLLLQASGAWLIGTLSETLRFGLDVDLRRHALDGGEIPGVLREIGRHFEVVAPPMLVLMAVLVLATTLFGYGQIGFRFSRKALAVRLERLNPVANLSRLLSFGSVVRALLSFFKLAVLAGVLWAVLRARWRVLATLHEIEHFPAAVAILADLAMTVFSWVAIVVLIVSVADIFWQRFEFTKSLMMTKQEVQDERKNAEGDPLIKSRLRSARMEIMRQRMLEAVPKADVVITNPEHFAVALRYDRSKNAAPEVVAKGVDELALRIRSLAEENDVPIMEDPPLARALYRAVKVGQEIPERFYQAVATILSHVFRMRETVA